MADRSIARELARQSIARGDPTGWFEELYRLAETRPDVVPWSDMKVNPHLASWAEKRRLYGKGQRALVVGCGYGYDAAWLASRGFDVTAFDVSPTAIASAQKRFQGSSVDYRVADALRLPREWRHAFDFVFEAYTLQVLQGDARRLASRNIAAAVKKTLLLICRGRDDDEDKGLMPWPLTKKDVLEVDLSRPDLALTSFEDFMDNEEDPPVRRFRAEYQTR